MENIITTEYNGTTITYDEASNTWKFTLRSRDRFTNSLTGAKEAIDKPVPADKAKAFQRIKAWFFRYGKPPESVEVTGVAEQNYHGTYVWIKDRGGKRSKESAINIYHSSTDGDAVVTQILVKMRQITALHEEITNLRSSLKQIEIKPEE